MRRAMTSDAGASLTLGREAYSSANAPCWTFRGTGGASRARYRALSREHSADPSLPDYGQRNGWDASYATFLPPEIPTYVGAVSFCKRPVIEDAEELARRKPDVAIVGAPLDEAVSYRPGARFGPRAIREATYNQGGYSLQLDVSPFKVLDVVDAGDANVMPAWLERGHAMIYRKVLEVAASGAVPIVLGGDHSITWPSAS